MKTTNLFLIAGVMAFSACSNNDRTTDNNAAAEIGTTESAKEHNEAKFDNEMEDDAKFMVNAAERNLELMRLSEIASQRSTDGTVKEMAKSLGEYHRKANDDLNKLAAKMNITIPTRLEDNNNRYASINDKNGPDFDRAYYDQLVEDHKDAIEQYEKISKNGTDAEVRNYAASPLSLFQIKKLSLSGQLFYLHTILSN